MGSSSSSRSGRNPNREDHGGQPASSRMDRLIVVEDSDNNFSSDDNSDTDFATILAQLIRSGRAQILPSHDLEDDDEDDDELEYIPSRSERMSCAFTSQTKPDTSVLKNSDISFATRASSGQFKYNKKPKSTDLHKLLFQREVGMNGLGQFLQQDRSNISHKFLPNDFDKVANYYHKIFCGTYSRNGDLFLSASQDHIIKVFDTSNGKFDLLKWIRARDVGWSVLDTALSPDGNNLIYSSWSESIHMCNLYGDTEKHEPLVLCPEERRFCIFSLMFSHDGREILGGANDGGLYIYDCESHQRCLRIGAHDDDVNTVAFADETSHILFSGADDGLCKVWDRRTLNETCPRPVGILAGHANGITFIDSRGDGRHLITNSKDQSIKLWDMRRFSGSQAEEETKAAVRKLDWDYRWQNIPRELSGQPMKIAGDTSVMTYRGHTVLQTLIRCRFSPAFSTGQRYIYTGCAGGKVFIYDVLTGKVEKVLAGHRSCVRDVSWHPYRMEIMDTSWDGSHLKWFYMVSPEETMDLDLQYEECDTECLDSDSDADEERRQRRQARQQQQPRSGVRRSQRLAAQAAAQREQQRRSSRGRILRSSTRSNRSGTR